MLLIVFGLLLPETDGLLQWSFFKKKRNHTCEPTNWYVKLNTSCTAKSDYLTLLPYYHNESKTDIQDQFVHDLSFYNGQPFKIWEPFLTNVLNDTKTDIPNELKDTNEIPVRHLLTRV